jgi:alkanesulfonate monooxygenase SsuD/methylene tetrahydromethanopterin reductase-like flavin-dependent oxidoreductase (luciferase family)
MSVLRALWTEEVVTFHGQWHHIDEMGLRPLPVQRPIPLWIGGHADTALRRAGTVADGWMPLRLPEEAPALIERILEYARAAGRDPKTIGIEAALFTQGKPPDERRREAEAWRALGATHLIAATGSEAGDSALQEQLEAIRQVKDAVRDLV